MTSGQIDMIAETIAPRHGWHARLSAVRSGSGETLWGMHDGWSFGRAEGTPWLTIAWQRWGKSAPEAIPAPARAALEAALTAAGAEWLPTENGSVLIYLAEFARLRDALLARGRAGKPAPEK